MRRSPFAALCRKELRSLFFSPVFYGTGAFFIFFLSFWLYYLQVFFALDSASLRPFFSGFPLAYIFAVPAITMKSWAEEKKLGTVEFLYTWPFSEWDLCIGKFLSSFIALLVYVLLTLPVPLSLLPLARFDLGVICAEYAGAVLLGAVVISIGQFFSCASKNQAAAFLGCSALLLVLMIPGLTGFGASLSSVPAKFINYVSLSFHFESFARGLLDSRDLAFFILSTALFLFLNTRVLIFGRRK